MKMKKILCFDIDNVICVTKNKKYKEAIPIKKSIKIINYLYKKNFFIKIYTGRGMQKFNGNLARVKKEYSRLTKLQLKSWGVKYHQLVLGKTAYDIFIDDKAINFKQNWGPLLLRKLKINEKI